MILKEREKNILAVISVAAVVLMYFYWTKGTIDRNGQILVEIKAIRKELGSPKVNHSDLEDLKKDIDTLNDEIRSLKFQIPETEKRDFLIRDLEALARKNGIELISFLPKEAIAVTLGGQEINEKLKKYLLKRKRTSVKGKVLRTVINIDSTGVFESYRKFFQDLILYYRAVDVADIVMSRANVAAKSGTDKRFGRGGRGKNTLESYQDTTLNVSFTLYAYTAIHEDGSDTDDVEEDDSSIDSQTKNGKN